MECLLAAHRSLRACYRAGMMSHRFLLAALLLAVAACGGQKASSGDAPTTPAPAAAADCKLEGSWTLELTWPDPLPASCADVKAPWDTALGFAMQPGGSEVEPDSAWGGSAIEVTKVTAHGCDVTVTAGSEGRETPDPALAAHFTLDGASGSGEVSFSKGDCRRSGSLKARPRP
jgi:hypothetical protein